MDSWIIWLILAAVLGIAEIFTLTAALGIVAVAALLTAGVAAVGLPIVVQATVFLLASGGGLVMVRPLALRHLQQPPVQRFGVAALVGKVAYVTKEVTG